MAFAGSIMQWRRAIVGQRIDAGSSIKKQSHDGFVAFVGSDVQWRIVVDRRIMPIDIGSLIQSESHLIRVPSLGSIVEHLGETTRIRL